MIKKNFFIVIAVLISGCYSGDNLNERLNIERLESYKIAANSGFGISEDDIIEIDPSSVKPILGKASDVFQNRSYIQLKTPEDIIIGEITKVRVLDSLILILDQRISKAAYLFNVKGEYLFTVGVRGGGPGEHDEPIDIAIKDKRILLTDLRFSIYEYDLDNRFIKKQDLPFFSHSMYVFDDKSLAFTNNATGHDDLSYQIMVIKDQEISKRVLRNTGTFISKYTSNPIAYNRQVHGDAFLFSRPWGRDIYQMSKDEVKLRYRILTENPIPEGLTEDPRRFQSDGKDYAYIFNWPILETQDLILVRLAGNQKLTTLVYDKQQKSLKSFSGLADDLLYGGISDYPIYVNQEDFYIPLKVEQMYAAKQEVLAVTDQELLEELREARPEFFGLMKNITEISNPILMKCEIQ